MREVENKTSRLWVLLLLLLLLLLSVLLLLLLLLLLLSNEELHSPYHSPNIVSVIKSRSLRWARHVARMEKKVFSKF